MMAARRRSRPVLGACLALAWLLGAATALAEAPVSEAKPFAEKFLLLQLSDREPAKQGITLSVAANLLAFYGPDLIDIEITTFGPGVELLYADNARRETIDSLMAQGVRFSVCMNTIRTLKRSTGESPALHPDAIAVDVGVAHILEQVAKGYVLVRP